jgi:hypothetical protein
MMEAERATILPGSAEPALSESRMGCQPAAFGSLPSAPSHGSKPTITKCWRQAAANYRLAACAPQK